MRETSGGIGGRQGERERGEKGAPPPPPKQ